jgi:uncharacterized membrane protein
MSTRNTIILSIILIVIATVASALVYNQLPEQVASHWNNANQVNGYMSRFWGAFLMPVVTIGILVLFLVIPLIDPLKANIAQFRGVFNAFIAMMIVFMVYVHGLTLAWNLGYTNFNMGTAMLPGLGLIFLFAGVMMRKAKRNFFIGIRTPWTLSSDHVWNETHRIGSILFIISGLLALLGAFFPLYAFWLLLIPLFASVIFLVIYSYVLYQRETKS